MNSDPVRIKASKQYWAGVQKWAAQQGLTKQEAHLRIKEQLKFDHLRSLPIKQLKDIAYQIGVIADGGAGL
jgi:hypothetical protein